MVSNRVCDFCQRSIIDSHENWGYHHRSVESVCTSSAQTCIFCDQLYGSYATKYPALRLAESKEWPVYRWSIRRSGSVRESVESFTLTFRPVHDPVVAAAKIEGQELKDFERSLPEESFVFFPSELHQPATSEMLDSSTSSDRTWQLVQKWLSTCMQNHPKCQQLRDDTREKFVPTRLLDVGCRENELIRIIETANNPVHDQYATLSHCWSLKPFINLTPQNKEWLMKSGISWHTLPLNFQHAIEATRKLGFRYIWIDSLCIMQGKRGDFHHEASLMHDVYRGSSCNFAAVDSADPHGGLFRSRILGNIVPVICRATKSNANLQDKNWQVVSSDYWKSQLLDKILYTRAWVFQERMLAPRILHFSQDQVLWDCATISACEAFPSGIPKILDTVPKIDRHWRLRLRNNRSLKYRPLYGEEDDSMEVFWKSAVDSYTRCNLTNGNDKLIAIWGVAKLVRDAIGQQFVSGLWDHKLEEQLAWRVVDGRQANGFPATRPVPNPFPSWSWASVVGVIEVQKRPAPQRSYSVVDHNGNDINTVFQDKERQARFEKSQERALRSWESELKRMDRNITNANKMFIPGSDQQEQHSTHMLEHPNYLNEVLDHQRKVLRDEHSMPILTASISIKCNIGVARVVRSEQSSTWTFGMQSSVSAFPDIDPGNDKVIDCHFAILACSETESDDNYMEIPEESGILFSGVGILLDSTPHKAKHYQRCGAFRFDAIDEKAFTAMQSAFLVNPDADEDSDRLLHDIWLD